MQGEAIREGYDYQQARVCGACAEACDKAHRGREEGEQII